ncbi:MAG: hypothetical protein RR645_07860, partial [Clostridium sp.]
KLLSIEGVTDNYFIDGTSFRILGRMIGESDIAIYGENKQLILKFRVKVEDYRNNIIDVKWNELENIDYIGETLNIFSVLDITRSFNDHVINKITLENNRNHKIRIKKDAYNSDECSIEAGDLYIDKDGNGRFSKEDIIIGKIKGKVIDKENIADINIFEEIPTEKGDKFVVVYTLYGYDKKTNSLDKILSTKAISVDV